jgi:hypothetical protein
MFGRSLRTLAFGGVVLGLLGGAVSIQANSPFNKEMYVSFSRSVSLPNGELAAGTYVFELGAPMSEQTIVRVSSRDRRKVYLQAFTRTIDRPANLKPGTVITFGESAAGVAPPLDAWYPDDSGTGRQFVYRN